jgi:hypothetical protein
MCFLSYFVDGPWCIIFIFTATFVVATHDKALEQLGPPFVKIIELKLESTPAISHWVISPSSSCLCRLEVISCTRLPNVKSMSAQLLCTVASTDPHNHFTNWKLTSSMGIKICVYFVSLLLQNSRKYPSLHFDSVPWNPSNLRPRFMFWLIN